MTAGLGSLSQGGCISPIGFASSLRGHSHQRRSQTIGSSAALTGKPEWGHWPKRDASAVPGVTMPRRRHASGLNTAASHLTSA